MIYYVLRNLSIGMAGRETGVKAVIATVKYSMCQSKICSNVKEGIECFSRAFILQFRLQQRKICREPKQCIGQKFHDLMNRLEIIRILRSFYVKLERHIRTLLHAVQSNMTLFQQLASSKLFKLLLFHVMRVFILTDVRTRLA